MLLHAALEPADPTSDDGARQAPARGNRRGTTRRTLRLKALTATTSLNGAPVVVCDISSRGLLIEGLPGALAKGDTLTIDLPEVGHASARVVWQSGPFSGCAFARPIPAGAISAALLAGDFAPGGGTPGYDRIVAAAPRADPRAMRLGPALLLSVLLWAALAVAGLAVLSNN